MKGKNLQLRILYQAKLSFSFDGEIKSFTDKQKLKRIQNHQTSFATNTKGTTLGGEETSNLKQTCTYIDCYTKTTWEQQTQKL